VITHVRPVRTAKSSPIAMGRAVYHAAPAPAIARATPRKGRISSQ
jgi:hypothetical protein